MLILLSQINMLIGMASIKNCYLSYFQHKKHFLAYVIMNKVSSSNFVSIIIVYEKLRYIAFIEVLHKWMQLFWIIQYRVLRFLIQYKYNLTKVDLKFQQYDLKPYDIYFHNIYTKIANLKTMIKIQEEQHGTETNEEMLRMFTFFHDSDSMQENNLIPTYRFTQDNILQIIEQNVDLRVTPLDQIQQYALTNYGIQEQEFKLLTSQILKKKRMMKRQKAKNRKCYFNTIKIQQIQPTLKTCSSVIDLTCDDLEKKRKRNRISAQISRDKKKIYIQELEQDNKRLAEQSNLLKKQNENLKHQLTSKKSMTENKFQSKQPKNIFIKLLVFLGFIFLLSLVRDTFKPRSKKSNSYTSISSFQQENLIRKTENLFQQSNFGVLKGQFGKSSLLSSFKKESNNIYIPSNLYEQVKEIQQQFE